ncbi:MAG: recombination regulator RecX [Patescibacteria group bacterium]|nr:recombination regulator RecX [Patescibacteria group bacterium]
MSDPFKIALHFLKFRPRSVFEIREKLRSKKYEEKEIDKVINVLKKNQLLDDKKFAKMWVADRNLLKPKGSYLLKLELKKLGVSKSIIETVLKCQNEEELARKALQSKSRLENADFQKKAAFLQRRGFGTSVIYKVLRDKK